MPRACANGCGWTEFGTHSTCCTRCKGASGPHTRDCHTKNAKVAGDVSAPAAAAGSTKQDTKHKRAEDTDAADADSTPSHDGSSTKRRRLTGLVPPVLQDRLGSNAKIIALFEEMAHIYKAAGDMMRSKAYTGAAAALRSCAAPVTSGKDAARTLAGIGKAAGEKIDEFLKTGTIKKLESIRKEYAALIALGSVHGIGPVHARELVAKGITSIPELRASVAAGKVHLSEAQLIGLSRLEDLQQRIPRDEVAAIGARITETAAKLDPQIKVTVCGSFRRGATSSGDIDILITHPKFTVAVDKTHTDAQRHNPLPLLVESLKSSGLLTDTLSFGHQKYSGVCKLGPDTLHRRIDILAVPLGQYWTAVCYFTGSGAFERALRQHAKELGFTLNEHALIGKNSREVPITCEEDIFEALGLDYVDKSEREYGK